MKYSKAKKYRRHGERGENDYITQIRGKKRHKELQTRKPAIAHV